MSEEKKYPKIPKCYWADWKYCWQRSRSSPDWKKIEKREYDINLDFCAACIAAHINWGNNGTTRRPLSKEEMLKEIESRKD